ncbi:MAG: hypothetical protein R6W06_00390 [Prochlorococcaceae cyanobacterium]
MGPALAMVSDRIMRMLLSFYREESALWPQLEPLHHCRFCRSWGVLRISCLDREHREEVNALLDLLRPPVLSLRLARQIMLLAPGLEPLTYPARVPITEDLLN